jgi:osmotically-inducible protein OsmY
MKYFVLMMLAMGLSGCEGRATAPSAAVEPDNTGVNERDRDGVAKTPLDQNENQSDIDITAKIRNRVVNSELSVNAQNVKIVTQNGQVTLRGPVKSAEEKKLVGDIAADVAGAKWVDNQLEIEN